MPHELELLLFKHAISTRTCQVDKEFSSFCGSHQNADKIIGGNPTIVNRPHQHYDRSEFNHGHSAQNATNKMPSMDIRHSFLPGVVRHVRSDSSKFAVLQNASATTNGTRFLSYNRCSHCVSNEGLKEKVLSKGISSITIRKPANNFKTWVKVTLLYKWNKQKSKSPSYNVFLPQYMTPITENGIRVEERGGRGRKGWSRPLLHAQFSACCANWVLS